MRRLGRNSLFSTMSLELKSSGFGVDIFGGVRILVVFEGSKELTGEVFSSAL